MQSYIRLVPVLSIVVLFVTLVSTMSPFVNDQKLTLSLRRYIKTNETANLLISFEYKEQEVQDAVHKLSRQDLSRTGKANAVTDILLKFAEVQRPVLELLSSEYKKSQCRDFESIWISNQIHVRKATLSLIQLICQNAKVIQLSLAEKSSAQIPVEVINKKHSRDGADTWGIDRIQARQAVKIPGYIFKNKVVVASIDSGVNGKHESLVQNYVGGKYGWLDAVGLSAEVCDVADHGTPTIGTVLGRGGIGVAPKAKWMACAAWSGPKDKSSFFALLRCAQFVLNPARWRGAHQDNLWPTAVEEDVLTQIIPNIVLCSWGSQTMFYSFYFALKAWGYTGIIPVFSAGNSLTATFEKPAWNQIDSPGDSPLAITVGSLQHDCQLAPYSCLGHSKWTALARKPDLVAPGTDVYSASCYSSNSYAYSSGTSMAAPHVAGVIALILGFNDQLTFDEVKKYLTEGTVRHNLVFPTLGQPEVPQGAEAVDPKDEEAEGSSKTKIQFPNGAVGYGLVNAFNSITNLVKNMGSDPRATNPNEDETSLITLTLPIPNKKGVMPI